MNPTQTHKVFGQGVRSMLAVAIAASAVSTASVKAGPTEDTIAAAMNATGIVSGVTSKTVKQVDKSWTPPSSFNQAMIASFAVTFSNPNIASVASKLTASKLFAFYQKGLPQYSPQLAQLAVSAALTPTNSLKYKDVNARVKDAAKIAGLAVKNGMKAYKNGTRNSGWQGFVATPAAVQQNLSNIAYSATAAFNTGLTVEAATTVTTALVKAAYKFKKTSTAGPGAAVLGFISQASEGEVNGNVSAIIAAAVKAAKAESSSIANAAAYALYAVYKQNGGTQSAADYILANQAAIFAAVLASDKKAVQATIFGQVANGVNAAATGLPPFLYGAEPLSPLNDLLVINNGAQSPVTKITNL